MSLESSPSSAFEPAALAPALEFNDVLGTRGPAPAPVAAPAAALLCTQPFITPTRGLEAPVVDAPVPAEMNWASFNELAAWSGPKPVVVEEPVAEPALAVEPVGALHHKQRVRTGQQVYAQGRDLVVSADVVSPAGEVMADGSIHVYGALRGRAMAGLNGNLQARIFCSRFEAEMVSIGDLCRVFEEIPNDLYGKPVEAWVENDRLHFRPIVV